MMRRMSAARHVVQEEWLFGRGCIQLPDVADRVVGHLLGGSEVDNQFVFSWRLNGKL